MVGAAEDGEIGGPEIGLTGARFGGASRRRRSRPGPVADGAPAPPAAEGDDTRGSVGLTGARFGGPSRRRRAAPSPPPPPPASPPPPSPVAEEPAPRPARAPRVGEPRVGEPRVGESRVGEAQVGEPLGQLPLEASPYATVRPYVLTGGRTRAGVEFAVEALVTAAGPPRPEPVEHTRIRALCSRPRSVAEVAALTGVPLGVARVLLGDMLAAGSVSVHRTADAGGPDLALMERVLSGLRRL